jgi:RsiW-degrading membrane proteinase PrsW (M82 family)
MARRVTTLIVGLLAALAGVALVVVGLVGAHGQGRESERFLTGAAAIPSGVLLLEIGLAAAWLAWLALRGRAGGPAMLPPWWASALVFLLAVGAGWLALHAGYWWIFFPFGTLAVFAPVALVGRLGLPPRGARPGWPRVLPAFAWGAIVAPLLAIVLELLAALGAIGAAAAGLALSGANSLDVLRRTIQHLEGRTLTDAQTTALVEALLRQPLVLAVSAFVLVFAGPVCEEIGKFGAVLLFSRARPGRGEQDSVLAVFLIGLASGLGFAVTENIFYTAQAGPTGWGPLVLARAATPLMHGTASAFFALGWARQARRPRGWALLWGALGAFAVHGAWNLSSGLLIVAGLLAAAGGNVTTLAGLSVLILLGVLALLVVSCIVTLLRLRHLLGADANSEDAPREPGAPSGYPAGGQAGSGLEPASRQQTGTVLT